MTGHQPDWIVAQCKTYGFSRPGEIPPEKISNLLADMYSDYACTNGFVQSREGAYNSFQGAIAFARSSGQPILETALAWLSRHQVAEIKFKVKF